MYQVHCTSCVPNVYEYTSVLLSTLCTSCVPPVYEYTARAGYSYSNCPRGIKPGSALDENAGWSSDP